MDKTRQPEVRNVIIFGRLLPLVLAVMVLPALAAPAPGLRTECKYNLRKIGVAAQTFSNRHNGRYPTNLSQLIPEYLEEIPSCPYAEWDTYSSTYRTTLDRRYYAVACTEPHPRQEGESAFLGYSATTGVAAVLAHDRPDRCARQLAQLGALCATYRQKHGALPKSPEQLSSSPKPEADKNRAVALSLRPDGSFQLTCLRFHLDQGLAPLEPRFDSRTQSVTKQRGRRVPIESADPVSPNWPALTVLVLLGLLAVLGFRRSVSGG